MPSIALIVAALAAVWNTTVSWVLRLFTPAPAIELPRIVLAPDTVEPVRTDLPGQVARL
ncbi:hypothetical protein [Streptomyces chartreusis]|uniref:Uncharacterized protein n=1 Tax=Streptomyces chartreusis TaxID=1969 RepID=A0A7H8TL75_STRCX|nr:hypothetical protein [Streptomyces chartreusis]QKZ23818.1 hypothetical protein HUT05_44565 [Streptomyces chartreusis]